MVLTGVDKSGTNIFMDTIGFLPLDSAQIYDLSESCLASKITFSYISSVFDQKFCVVNLRTFIHYYPIGDRIVKVTHFCWLAMRNCGGLRLFQNSSVRFPGVCTSVGQFL